MRKIQETVLGNHLEFYTGSGVFSPDKIDKGSSLLAENAIIKEGWRVLDLGCGYGAVGIAVAQAHGVSVVMTDVNKRAIMLARRNVKMNSIDAEVKQGDSYEKIDGIFDTILLNPPQHAGKDVCFTMIQDAPKYLKQGGLLQVVARHNKGGRSLSKKMEDVFGNVKDIAKKGGFRVYVSELN